MIETIDDYAVTKTQLVNKINEIIRVVNRHIEGIN